MGKGPVLRLKPMKPGARKPGSHFVTNTTDSAHSSRTQELFMHDKCRMVKISMKQCFLVKTRHSGFAAKAEDLT